MDLISSLPLHIIHKIMSHLSTKELAQTSLLSRKWKNNIRPTFPIFIFNQLDFIGKDVPYSFCPMALFKHHPENFTESLENLGRFVDSTLDQFCDRDETKLRIQKFKLIIGIPSNLESWFPLVDKWIGLAIEHQVKNLNLHFQIFQNGLYPLPETVFLAKSINILKLHGCKLNHHPSSNYAFKFHSLTMLKLERVNLDEQMIQKLTSNSPLLEDIDIIHCWGFAYVHVPKLPRLRTFVISSPVENLTSIKIAAPNLRHCSLSFYEMENPPSRISLAESCNLRILDLTGSLIGDRVFDDLISKFPLLEELSVQFCHVLKKVNISSQTLKLLDLRECSKLETIHIDAPNLVEFFLFNQQIPMGSINAPCPWEISIDAPNVVDTLWYLKLRRFLETSSLIKWLNIDMMPNEHSFNLEVFRRNSPPPPREIQELYLTMVMPESEYAAVIDGYFSVCHPKTLTLQTHGHNERSNFYMWVYEKLKLVKGDTYCCSCSNGKCWRHYLKNIKLETFSFKGRKVFLHFDAWENELPNLPKGILRFALEWCSDVNND